MLRTRNQSLSFYGVICVESEELGFITLRCNRHWATGARGSAFVCREEWLSFAKMLATFGCFKPERMNYGDITLNVEMYLRIEDISRYQTLVI